ncbi:uncharacterized protein TRIADDRAFT_20543 [Trichoplax adhaerens]|uniref:Tetraspanin n=1 Tax=Trichoplax adhaerens TaxID=10228 RepID=B3RQD0_TRIAD|nr:hypothetical protein TRIADDRAFT_20543 [Trichoplax adhaerens]EDV28322.1 hypothetical protein TRIADDRAFT_20543 [Trichoplax adhaerens]|eukprot:XP_002110156.1 hypothetical protein TRIADDRAFT_20543 [Trichoplax adhaerens]
MAYKSALQHLEQSQASCNFYCCRRTLIALNACYLIIGIILISTAAGASITKVVTSLPVVGAIITIGIFLILVSIFGAAVAICHSSIGLLFYTLIMVGVFTMQFAVSIAALSINRQQEHLVMSKAWDKLPWTTRHGIQERFDCCGFDSSTGNASASTPSCHVLKCYRIKQSCSYCYPIMKDIITAALKGGGGVGLFFSFFDFLGIFFAHRLRRLQDPIHVPTNHLY